MASLIRYAQLEDDPLPARQKLVTMANHIATTKDGAGGAPGTTPPVRLLIALLIRRRARHNASCTRAPRRERERPHASAHHGATPSPQVRVHRGVSVTRVSRQTDGTILLEGMRESAVVGEGAVVGDEPLPMEPFSLRVDTLVSQVITSDYDSDYASDYASDYVRLRL